MTVDREWLKAEAARLGIALTEEDVVGIAAIMDKTRAELAAVEAPAAHDPAIGFLPFDV